MDEQRLNIQVAEAVGGNSRMVRRKDTEHMSGLMETDTWGNTWRMTNTGMEYTDIQVEVYTKDN